MRKFSCKYFFSKISKSESLKSRIIESFYVKDEAYNEPCNFEQIETDAGFSPEKHLVNCHGFIHNAPVKIKRELEVKLCRLIERNLQYIK